jgi:hypothetical protein
MPLSPYRQVRHPPQLSNNPLQSPGRGSSRSIPNGSSKAIQQHNFDKSRIPQDFNGLSRGWTGNIVGEVIANVVDPEGPVGIPDSIKY